MQRFAGYPLGRLDVLLGNTPPLISFDELEALTRLVGLQADLHVTVVARPPVCRMYLPSASAFLRMVSRIGHLRLADVRFDLVLALHAVDEDLEVKLAHAADDGLAGIDIGLTLEGWIFLRQPRQRDAHLLLIALGLRLNRHRDDRLREVDGDSSTTGADRRAHSIASLQFFEADCRRRCRQRRSR